MSNSATPTGENGRQELKVTRNGDADKLLDKFFEDLKKEGYGKIELRALTFDVPELTLKSKVGDEQEQHSGLSDVINVLSSGKRTIELEELVRGMGISLRFADIEKVKKKTEHLRNEKLKKALEQKELAGGTEKPDNRDR